MSLIIIIALSFLAMFALGAILGLGIGLTAKYFGVETDPRIAQIQDLLPSANCGGCGYAGCADFAKALVEGSATDPGKCAACSDNCVKEIAKVLGLSNCGSDKKVAIILCSGSNKVATHIASYNGIADCQSASLIAGGVKGCRSGCLGYASCANICPFHAIEMQDGLAFVHNELCVGCGKCLEVCPRKLIKLVPQTAKVHVFCSSPDKGADKRNVCKSGCLGCRKCMKVAGEEAIQMSGFLAKVNYEHEIAPETVLTTQCPTKCFRLSKGYEIAESALDPEGNLQK